MKGRPQLKPGQAQKAREAMQALYGPAHTYESLAKYDQERIAEMARAEERRRAKQGKPA